MQNSFEMKYNNLSDISKKAVNAYRSGREFMVTGLCTNGFGVVIEGRLYPTIISSVVNAALSCELFLKSMIMIKNNSLPNKDHNLLNLYNELGSSRAQKKLSKFDFASELDKISNAFFIWRYSYEYDNLILNNGFLFELCRELEKESRDKILETYDLDMSKSFL